MGQIEPGDREEMLLQGILNGDTTTNIEPGSRKEMLLKAILENGGGGGGGATTIDLSAFALTSAKDISSAFSSSLFDSIVEGTTLSSVTVIFMNDSVKYATSSYCIAGSELLFSAVVKGASAALDSVIAVRVYKSSSKIMGRILTGGLRT